MYARLLTERLAVDDDGDWDAFATRNADLFERGLVERYYRPETLASDFERLLFRGELLVPAFEIDREA